MLELVDINILFLLCDDVNLPLQMSNTEIFAALLTNRVDSLSWYFIIVFSIICMAYSYM